MMTKRLVRVGFLAANVLFTTAAFACPMCKDSAANKHSAIAGVGSEAGGGGSVGGGFNHSIYILLVGLFGALGLVGFNLARGIRSGNGPDAGAK